MARDNRDNRNSRRHDNDEKPEFDERVVSIKRCSKVVKGGRNFSFSALIVVGNRKGKVGVGLGKANEISDAIRKGGELARKHLAEIPLRNGTIPHEVTSSYGAGKILLRPASAGTGLIAGGGMRAVLDLAGVNDVLAKSLGSKAPVNVVRATMKALTQLSSYQDVLAKRGRKTL